MPLLRKNTSKCLGYGGARTSCQRKKRKIVQSALLLGVEGNSQHGPIDLWFEQCGEANLSSTYSTLGTPSASLSAMTLPPHGPRAFGLMG